MDPRISVKAAAPEDWPAIWQSIGRIVAAGELSWLRDITEEEAGYVGLNVRHLRV